MPPARFPRPHFAHLPTPLEPMENRTGSGNSEYQHNGIVFLDRVYCAKGAAGFIDRLQRGEFAAEEDFVFVHTGGSQALFACNHDFPYDRG